MLKLHPLRIYSLLKKETLILLRDPKSRMALIMPPLLQLFIFAFAATLEVKNVSIGIYNQDYGRYGYDLVSKFYASPIFTKITFIDHHEQIQPLIDLQKVSAVLVIPQDFSKKIEAATPVRLQVLLDGRKSNTTQIIGGYILNLLYGYNTELNVNKSSGSHTSPLIMIEHNRFNHNLLYIRFTLPSLIGILGMLIVLVITSLSIARERETGTFEQTLVSPLNIYEILIGKMLPALMIGMCEALLIWLVATQIFHIPFTGSFLLFLGSLFLFVLSIVGVGLFISSLCNTQQQALLGTFIFMVPATSLSGYAAPVDNMPHWLQLITAINPLKHFLIIVRGLFLKDMPLKDVCLNAWPLIVISCITLSIAGWHFKNKNKA